MIRSSAAKNLAADTVARISYGRMLSWLAWSWNDIAAAEDALSDALLLALENWPESGVPDSPEGWLMTTAKRKLLHAARHRRVSDNPAVSIVLQSLAADQRSASQIPDARLRMMFVCAHPTIDEAVRPALMLQTVLGIDAERIARALLISPDAMAKRLVRAKAKIRIARISFEEPEGSQLQERVAAVLEAIYGAYTLDADGSASTPPGDLAEEAAFLSGLIAQSFPQHPEALGLHALILYCEARRATNNTESKEFVALPDQDCSKWNPDLIEAADQLLTEASKMSRPGAYQLEAAIQSAHCHRPNGQTPWDDIVTLYQRLIELHPSIGAHIGYAVALGEARGKYLESIELLDALPDDAVRSYRAWHVSRAYLLERSGQRELAAFAYARALELTLQRASRLHLKAKLRLLA